MSPILVVIAPGFHLFPFRTEKLSPVTPMVLHTRGRVGSRQLISKTPSRAIRRESFFLHGLICTEKVKIFRKNSVILQPILDFAINSARNSSPDFFPNQRGL